MDAKHLAPSPDAIGWDLAGRLGTFSLSDIFQMLSFSGKTGTLTLIQGWNTRTISFRQGRICYIAAGTRLPTVLELLVRGGHVTRAQLAEIARRGVNSEADVVPALVAAGIVADEDVQRSIEQQLESTIYSLFLWRNCIFTFLAGDLVLEGGVPVDLDSEHLIIEGTRRVDEWIQISPIVPSVFMIFQRRPVIVPSLHDEELPVYHLLDGVRDVATIAQETGRTQFEVARVLYHLVRRGVAEAAPPNKMKIMQLFNLAVESIHMKLMMYGHSREALELENQLNRFARDNRLKVRMSGGRVVLTDLDTPVDATSLIDLYKLFIGIQNNKFSKVLEPAKATGLMEGLYRHTDPEFRSMMRMYEFYEIEGLLPVNMFEGLRRRA
jgi:hypothetical protein